jgi:hypothetical protein
VAYAYRKCKECKGNMWPSAGTATGVVEHGHVDHTTMNNPLKLKLRVGKRGWNKAANPRSNSPIAAVKSLSPRKKAYGPF